MSECLNRMEFKLIGKGKVGDVVEVCEGKKHPSVIRIRSKLVVESISRISSSTRVRGLSCTTDEDGNVYILGQFFENMFADNINLTTPESGIFLAQIGPKGQWKWATTLHNHQSGNDINMSCEITYHNRSLYSAMVIRNPGTNITEGFVIKTDRGGNISYRTRFTGDLVQQIRISVDRNGNAYIVNSYNVKLELSDAVKLPEKPIINLGSTGFNRGYVAKLNKNGVWIWARDISGFRDIDSSNLNDIATQPNGNSFVVGNFIGTVILDDMKIRGTRDQSTRDFILAEIGSDGNWIRAEAFPGGEGSGIELDECKNIYVVGVFFHKMKFCGCHVNTCGRTNLFVAKLDRKWKAEWVVSTRYSEDLLFTNLNITLDNENNSYIDGMFNQPIVFGGNTLVPRTDNDEFIAQLSPDGSWLWSTQISGNDNSVSKDLTVDDFGNLYLTGGFDTKMIIGEKCHNQTEEFAPGIFTLYLIKFHPKLPKLLGIIGHKIDRHTVNVGFKGPTESLKKLEVGQDYYVDKTGYINTDPKNRYIGTGIGRNKLFLH